MSDVTESPIERRHSDMIAIGHIGQVRALTRMSDLRQRLVYSIQK